MSIEALAEFVTLSPPSRYRGGVGTSRVYLFVDGVALEHPPLWDARGYGYAKVHGEFDPDTCRGLEVVDLSTWNYFTITPRPGSEVSIKFWHPARRSTRLRLHLGEE